MNGIGKLILEGQILNQAPQAGMRLVLKVDPVQIISMCVHVCVFACVCVCVCVSTSEAINN